jgi:tRNA pseudouridine13 synthase
MESSPTIHERDDHNEDSERSSKRVKLIDPGANATGDDDVPQVVNPLPPSHALLGVPPPISDGLVFRIMETDVGISEYVGRDVPKIHGIIKQRFRQVIFVRDTGIDFYYRFTDFLVYEVDLDSQVVHIKSLAMPELQKKNKPLEPSNSGSSGPSREGIAGNHTIQGVDRVDAENEGTMDDPVQAEPAKVGPLVPRAAEGKAKEEPWPERFTSTLTEFLSEDAVIQLKNMFLEGPEPPLVSDKGWSGRLVKPAGDDEVDANATPNPPDAAPDAPEKIGRGKRGRDRGGRGGRGGRGSGRGGRAGGREDNRKVSSDVRLSLCQHPVYSSDDLIFPDLNSQFRPRPLARHCIKQFVNYSVESSTVR